MADIPNTIDELMDKDPLLLTEQDLAQIITYQRQQRVRFDSGIKPKKDKGPQESINLVERLGLAPKPSPIKRRV